MPNRLRKQFSDNYTGMFYSWETHKARNTPMLQEQRPVYVSSGRFVLSDLLVSAFFLSGIALLIASILAWLTSQEFYGVGSLWFFPASIVGGLVWRTVAATKLRNRLVGFVLGFFVGTIVVMGTYHIDQCSRWGVGWERIDRLPGYITFRMETDGWIIHKHAAIFVPVPEQAGIVPWQSPRVRWNWHWAGFLGEFIFLICLPGMVGLLRAKRPFSEELDAWFSQESLIISPDSASDLRAALESGSLDDWVHYGIEKTGSQEKHVAVTLWYCPRPSTTGPSESSVYIAFGSGPLYLLEPEEAATLAQLVPGLAEFAIPAEAKYDENSASPSDPTVARLIKLSGPHVGRVKKPSVKWWGRVKLYSMMMMMMPAAGPALLMAYLVGANPPPVAIPEWILIVAFFIALIAWVIFCRWWYNEDDNPMWRMLVRHYRNAVAGEIALRSDVLVSPNDRGAIYINEIPRRFWGNLSEAKKDSESGFLLIDADRDQFLFEGDRFRYIIPVASILRCEVEEVTKTQSTAGFYAVVLIARTKTGTHEFSLLPISGIEGENRYEKAYALQNLIWTEFGEAIQRNSMHHDESSSTNPNGLSPIS
jgi:hypothetical protein